MPDKKAPNLTALAIEVGANTEQNENATKHERIDEEENSVDRIESHAQLVGVLVVDYRSLRMYRGENSRKTERE